MKYVLEFLISVVDAFTLQQHHGLNFKNVIALFIFLIVFVRKDSICFSFTSILVFTKIVRPRNVY